MPGIVRIADVPAVEPSGGSGSKRVVIGKDTGATKLQIQFLELSPGRAGTYHFHPDAEQITVILDGSGDFLVEGKRYHVERDSVLFFGVGEKHSITPGEKGVKIIEVYSAPEPQFIKADE